MDALSPFAVSAPFLLALAAVGLLGLAPGAARSLPPEPGVDDPRGGRGSWVDRTLATLLALLAAGGAALFWYGASPGLSRLSAGSFSALLALQALALLAAGTLRPRLRFVPRYGLRPLLGGGLLLYLLALRPLLATAGWLDLESSPFPAMLVVLAFLLFLDRPFPRYVLVPALLWAAIGGPGIFLSPAAPEPLLALALVAGASLLVPAPRWVRDFDGDYRPLSLYEHAYEHRRGLGRALWLLLLISAGLSALALTSPFTPLATPLRQLAFSSLLLSLLAIGPWLFLTAWFNSEFRSLAWGVVGGLRRLYTAGRWVAVRWYLVLTGGALGVWAAYLVAEKPPQYERFFKSEALRLTALLVLLAVALRLFFLARRRIVILEFKNHTGKKELDGPCGGVASRLCNELIGISSLYKTIDEASPQRKGQITGAAPGVEDIGEAYSDSIGPDAAVEIKGLRIPVGLLSRAVVRGPRLSGSLHQDGDGFLLLASLSGGGLAGNWRMRSGDLGAASQDRRDAPATEVQKLTERLAYRIVTDISSVGSPRWEAVRHFTEGLRAYRRTQHTTQDVGPDLRTAEREFIHALSEDHDFVQCHYDLGVVYQALGELDSAEAGYRKIQEEDPTRWEAYHALASLYFDRGGDSRSMRNAALVVTKATESRPGYAPSWNLLGVARHQQLTELRDLPTQAISTVTGDDLRREIVRDFEIATAVAWRSLGKAALARPGQTLLGEIQEASLCASNLGIVLGEEKRFRDARRVLGQALRLTPHDARLHLEQGKVLFQEARWSGGTPQAQRGRWERARTELYRAFGDGLSPEDRGLRWIYLLATHAHLYRLHRAAEDGDAAREEAGRVFFSCRNFLDFAAPDEDLVLAPRPADSGAADAYLRQLGALRTGLAEVGEIPAVEDEDLARICRDFLTFLEQLESATDPARWPSSLEEPRLAAVTQAQNLIARARQTLDDRPADARRSLEQAIAHLTDQGHHRQAERQGLHSLLAKACILEARRSYEAMTDFEGGRDATAARLREALGHAQTAVDQRPESPTRRWILSEVYCALRDFPQAETERGTALQLGSSAEMLDDCSAMDSMADAYLAHSRDPNPEAQRKRLAEGQRFFQQALRIIESKPLSAQGEDSHLAAHAAAHYWLGRFSHETGKAEQAMAHLRIARSMGFRSIEGRLQLGLAYAEVRAYDDAEKAFREAMAEIRHQRRTALRTRRETGDMENEVQSADLEGGEPATDALAAEIVLHWALLHAERGILLQRARKLAEIGRARLLKMSHRDDPSGRPEPQRDLLPEARRRALWSLYWECSGWISFLERRDEDEAEPIRRSLAALETALRFRTSPGLCLRVAEAARVAARLDVAGRAALRRKAASALDLAEKLDFQQRHAREIARLRQLDPIEEEGGQAPQPQPRSLQPARKILAS